MIEQPNTTKSTFEGVTVRTHADSPMFRVAEDGRIAKARGFWLNPYWQQAVTSTSTTTPLTVSSTLFTPTD